MAKKEAYSEKVDVYSFGVLVWQMAKDRTPFKGTVLTIISYEMYINYVN